MPRNNALWILVLAGVGSIERDEPTSREKRIPEFFLQFLDLSFKIRDESRLFLEFSRLDQVASGMADSPETLEELDACMTVKESNLSGRVTPAVTHRRASPSPLPFDR